MVHRQTPSPAHRPCKSSERQWDVAVGLFYYYHHCPSATSQQQSWLCHSSKSPSVFKLSQIKIESCYLYMHGSIRKYFLQYQSGTSEQQCTHVPSCQQKAYSKTHLISQNSLQTADEASPKPPHHISKDVWPSKPQRFLLSLPTVFRNNWVTSGEVQLAYSANRYKFSSWICTGYSDVNRLEYKLLPNIFLSTQKWNLEPTPPTSTSSAILSLPFLPVQALPLSQLSHRSISDQAQKENVCMLNAHTCISKKLAGYAG